MQFSTNRISVSRPLAVFVMSMMLMVSPLGRPALAGHYPGAISLTSATYNSSNNTTTYTWTLTGQGGSASHVVINTCLGNTAISTGGSPDSQATYTNPDSTTGKTGYKWESGSDLVTGDTFILTFSGNTGTSGTATWTIKKGSDSAHFNSGNTGGPSCSTPPPPTSVTASASPGACVFTNGVSFTPVTASINPAGGATVALSKAGVLVYTFPTSGTSYNASPGTYTWVATAASGYVLSGTSTGEFAAASCTLVLSQTFTSQPVSVLGVKVVKGQAVKGQTLPNTGPGVPVDNSLALAFASILIGLLLSYAGRRKAVAAKQ